VCVRREKEVCVFFLPPSFLLPPLPLSLWLSLALTRLPPFFSFFYRERARARGERAREREEEGGREKDLKFKERGEGERERM
jgi:hypothetical protein